MELSIGEHSVETVRDGFGHGDRTSVRTRGTVFLVDGPQPMLNLQTKVVKVPRVCSRTVGVYWFRGEDSDRF